MAKRIMVKNPVTDSERMRCIMLGSFGGPHHKYIAKRLYGNGNPDYTPSAGEVARVGKILAKAKVSTRAWRDGETTEAEKFFNKLCRASLEKLEESARQNKLHFKIVAA